jgi:hypothetical protein
MRRHQVWFAAAALTLLTAPAALAQPANDEFGNAVVIPSVPFAPPALDTTEATTAADDPFCAGNGHTVWYSFTPSLDQRVEINTFGSNYDTTMSVYTGSQANLDQIACNDDTGSLQSRVRFDATAGTTYFVMAGSFFDSPGGSLVLSVVTAPPPLQLEVSIDRFGSVDRRTGVAIVRGVVTCSRSAPVEVFGSILQTFNRIKVEGQVFAFVENCDGRTPWVSEPIASFNGVKYGGGRAAVGVVANAFTEDTSDDASATINLR